jgi:hypothetical protein
VLKFVFPERSGVAAVFSADVDMLALRMRWMPVDATTFFNWIKIADLMKWERSDSATSAQLKISLSLSLANRDYEMRNVIGRRRFVLLLLKL